MRAKALTETALLVAAFVLIVFMIQYAPLGAILAIVIAVPHAVITHKHGLKLGVIALVAAAMILFLLMDVFAAFMMVSSFGLIGVVLGFGTKRFGSIRSVLLATIIAAISFALLIYLSFVITGFDYFGEMLTVLKESFSTAADLYEARGLDTSAIDQMVYQLDTLLMKLIPTSFILFAFVTSYVNYKMFRTIGRRLKIDIPPLPNILQVGMPKWTALAFVVGYSLMILPGIPEFLQVAGLNLRAVFGIAMFIQGVSLFAVYAYKHRVPRLAYLIVVLLVLFNPMLQSIASLVGLFDILFDYRSLILGRS